MLRKTIEIATPGTRLSVAHKQLVLDRPEQPKVTLPIEDLGVVIVDDFRACYTQAVFLELLDAGATVMVCGRDHLPAGMMLPLDAHHAQTEIHHAQIEASEPVRKRLWQSLISAKLMQQGRVLEHFNGHHGGLFPMSKRVRSGDPENLEAQGAQRYWPQLFGPHFRRDRDQPGENALLNYGYAVIRAAVARSIVASGLLPSFGVFHHNRSNPFCLADDLLEPFRPYVDWRVRGMLSAGTETTLSLDDRMNRAALLSLFNETVLLGGRRMPLLLAIETSAVSLRRVLTGDEKDLLLPESLPLPMTEADDEPSEKALS